VEIIPGEAYNKRMKFSWMPVILIAALSGCQLLPGQNPTPTRIPLPTVIPVALSATATRPAAAPTLTSLPGTTPTGSALPAGPLILVSRDLTASSVKPPYEIKIHYPEISGAGTPGLSAFNSEAKKMAQELLAGFQKDFDQAQPLPQPSAASDSFMETNYTVAYGQHGLLSILSTIGFYYSGAAHPNSYAGVLNFDLIHGKKLELADLFLPGSNYLKTVSDACTTELQKRDRLSFPEGALPTAENYKNWNITPQGLQFSFDPYQVAAYAMGPSRVILSYESLKTQLNPDGPLAVLLK
jgi:hypothetical protein